MVLFFSKKRGLSQIDWAISLGIFLLFLVWFFIFVTPSLSSGGNTNSLVYLVEKGLDNYRWNVYKIPLFLNSEEEYPKSEFEPFFLDFSPNYGLNYTIYSNKNNQELYYDSALNGIVFLNKDNILDDENFIVGSTTKYSPEYSFYDIFSNNNRVGIRNSNFFADFSSGLISNFLYDYNLRVDDIEFLINDLELSDLGSYNVYESPIYVLYSTKTYSFNLSQFVFANNPGVYGFLDFFDLFGSNFDLEIKMRIFDYSDYYISNLNFGSLDYQNRICYNYSDSFINFYDDTSGFSLIFSEPVLFDFCLDFDEQNNYVDLSVSKSITNNLDYKFIFYDGDYSEAFNYKGVSRIRAGVFENLYGIKEEKLRKLNRENNLNEIFNYPYQNNFKIIINDAFTNEEILSIQTQDPDINSNVYAKEYFDFLLDEYGNLKRVVVNILTW